MLLFVEYDECINSLLRFRNAHFGLVRSYVLKFIEKDDGNKDKETDIHDASANVHGEKGSGGSIPRVMLNDIIAFTQKSIIGITPKKKTNEFVNACEYFVTNCTQTILNLGFGVGRRSHYSLLSLLYSINSLIDFHLANNLNLFIISLLHFIQNIMIIKRLIIVNIYWE